MPSAGSWLRSVACAGVALLALIVAGCGQSSSAPDEATDALSEQLGVLVNTHGIPGAVGIVIERSSVAAAGAAGVRRAGAPDHITTDDLVHIGSIGKSMTATMIAKLVDDGSLSWESRPSDVIPDLSGTVHPGYEGVTLLDILRHRGGMPADGDLTEIPVFTGTLTEQRAQAARLILEAPPAVTPGRFRYSNAGYVVAAAMAEAATGRSWRELMDTLVFQPLGIDAFYGWPTEHDANQPSGHVPGGSGYIPVEPSVEPDSLEFAEPAGFISMNVAGLAKFMQLHIDGARRRPRLLTQESFDVLHAPVDGYACGLVVVQGDSGTLLWHNGSNNYFFSVIFILPDREFAVAIMVNAGGNEAGTQTQRAVETIAESLVE